MTRISLTIFMLVIMVSIQAASITSTTSGNWSATAWPNTNRTGTITTSTVSSLITGTSTLFTTEISVGNIIKTSGNVSIGTVASITDNTHLVITAVAASSNLGIAYRSQGVGPVDAVTIASGASILVDGVYSCASISFTTVSTTTSLTINGNNSLTVAGGLSMARPSNGATCTINVGAGSLTTSTLTMNATTSGRNDVLSISTGTVTIAGAITIGTTGCLINFTGAGTFKIGGAFSATPSVTQYAGNTWNYYGTSQNVLGISYNNLTLSGSGSKTTSGVTVNGILSMEGTATASSNPTYGPAATLQYNTATSRIAGNEWISPFIATGGIIIANTGIITLNSAEIVNAPLTINSGASLSTNSSTSWALTFGDDFINNGTFNAYSSSITISGSGDQNISGFTTTGSISMTKTGGTATLTGNIIGGSLTINGSGGTLNLGTGLNHTINGAWTLTNGAVAGGSSLITIGGNATSSAGTFAPGTSTVNYNGTSAPQSTANVPYYNLTLSGTGLKTLQSGSNTIMNNLILSGTASFTAPVKMTIGGDFTIGTGTTFNASAFINNLAGNWTNNGTYITGTGGINLNGTTNQIIGGSGTNLYNMLTISNASGASLSGNVSVTGILSFVNGKISTGAYSLSIGNSAIVAGAGTGKYVFGNLQMGIPAAAIARTFDIGDATVYTPVTLSFTGTTNSTGSITLNTAQGNSPNIGTSNINPALNVNRYWTITNNAVSGFSSYDATFNFVAGDIIAGTDYASLIAGEYSASSWSYPVTGTTAPTSVQVAGITSFGQFQLGQSAVLIASQYNSNGSIPAVSDLLPCINMPSNPLIVSSSISVRQYFTMNVVKGLTYEVYTCNSSAPSNPLMLTVYKEGAPADPYIAFSSVNTGNPCSSFTNDVYVSFIPSFSGEVRVLFNRKGNSSSTSPVGLTIKANVTGGYNTLDDQTMAGTDKWIGHIYDGTAFNNYLGYYLTGSESFQESFGTTGTWPNNTNDDITCFNVLSEGAVHASVLDISFSVRYRMNSTKHGLYTASMTSDDGSRLYIDNKSIYSNWSDHSPVTSSNVLFSLTGSSSLAFEYYENGGQNVAGFTNLFQVLSNTLTQNLNQQIYLNNSGSVISGDVYGTLPAGITLSGTGYQWAYSTSANGPWINISGATSATFTPAAASSPFNVAGTYYIVRYAVLSSNNNISPTPYIATSQSNYALITVSAAAGTWLGISSTDWHTASNWSGGIPLTTTDVVIPSGTSYQPSVITDVAVCHNLTINSGGILTISAGKQMTVAGTLLNNAGSDGLVLQSSSAGTASLVHNSDNVAATVSRYIPGNSEAWHFLSSPVVNQIISGDWLPSGTYGNGTGYDLYVWDESSSCWIYKLNVTSVKNWNTVHPVSNFMPGRGYLYSVQAANPTKQFKGILNNGNINIPITSASINTNLKGFNLVGNPYSSSIDWQAQTGWSRSDLVTSNSGYDMWIWNPSANNYGVINSSGGTGTNSVTRYIPPMQGFFVRANVSGTMGITNSVRINAGTGNWFKKSLSTVANPLSVIANSEDGTGYDEIQLLFGSTENVSGATKLFSPVTSAPSLYMSLQGDDFSLRYLTDTIDNHVVPVMFKPGKDGFYTLQFRNIDQFQNMVLEDRQTNNFQDIKATGTYRFKASVKDDPGRFFIHFVKANKPISTEVSVSVYEANNKLVINLTQLTTETEIFVTDMTGRILIRTKLEGESIHSLDVNAKSQLLIISLKNQARTVCRKVMWVTN